MSHDLQLDRLIDTSPEEAFTAFTDPDAMIEWYEDNPGWKVRIVACDVRVGGTTIVEFGPDGSTYSETMTYSVVEPPHRLEYHELFGTPDGTSFETNVTVTFEAQDGKTLVAIEQTGFPNAEIRDAHKGGWPGFIDRLGRAAAGRRVS
ncbi:MAG: SRPBCC domain-containing protein [Actinomycetota bacterium]